MGQQLLPINSDGFETGDYRNFAPIYLGNKPEWIRPTATVIDEEAINGNFSLQWIANEDPHNWALVSNSFYLTSSLTASVSIRINSGGDETYSAGFGIAETQDRATVARITESGFELTTDMWTDAVKATADVEWVEDEVYEISLSLTDSGKLVATVKDEGKILAELQATIPIEPNAMALTVETVANGNAEITFDDVEVDANEYHVREDEWTRSPQFVVLPRIPDVGEDQGNWVGAASVIDETEKLRMWYRIRNNEGRGAGFGLAESEDGLTWEKHDDNPVILPEHGQDSNEGLSVLRVDGLYHAWYTINRDGTWHIVYVTSEDGVNWTDHGVVIEGYCKDPVVLHVDGTYFMYAIAPSNTEFSVYTSRNGREWTCENTIDFENHGHPGAYYTDETETFWLFAFAEEGKENPPVHVRRASSDDGIHFEDFEQIWQDPPIGLDHRSWGGIDYGAFPGDGHGHLEHDRRTLMYYQARHNYQNNRPGWQKAGDGKVVLGGRFTGLFEGVTTSVGEEEYAYHSFPMHATPISDLNITASESAIVTIEQWAISEDLVAQGTVETINETTLTVSVTGLDSNRNYTLALGENIVTFTTDSNGAGTAEIDVAADARRRLELAVT